MINLSRYFEQIAQQFVGHTDMQCHFADGSMFATKVPRNMHYPCLGVDTEGFVTGGQPGAEVMSVQFNMYVLDHVADTGNMVKVLGTFGKTFETCVSIISMMKKTGSEPGCDTPARFFDFAGCEGTRIEFKDAALYGYAVSLTFVIPFDWMACVLGKKM